MGSYIRIIIIILISLYYIIPEKQNKKFVKYFSIINDNFLIIEKHKSIYILKSQNNTNQYLYICRKCHFSIGDTIYFKAQILPFLHKLTPLSIDYSNYITKYNLTGFITAKSAIKIVSRNSNILTTTRNNFINIITSNSSHPLALALLSGNKSNIPKDLYEKFRITGAAHILAISGLHISGIAFIFFYLIRTILSCSQILSIKYNNKKIAICLSYLAALFFLFIADFPISGQRALIFLTLIYIAILFNYKIAPINLVLLSIIILLLLDHHNLFHPAFQMSIAAVTVICKFINQKNNPIYQTSPIKKIYQYEKDIFIISCYISIAILPFTIYHFSSSSLIAPITNLIIIPLVTLIIMPFGILSLGSSIINLESFFFALFDKLLILFSKIIIFFSKFAINTPDLIELNHYSLILVLSSLIIFLVSTSRKFEIIAFALYLLAFIVGNLDLKPDLTITPYNKTFIAKTSNNHFLRPNRKISSYRQTELKKYYKNISVINSNNHIGKYLLCNNRFCIYKKNSHIVTIINKNLSYNKFQAICKLSNIVIILNQQRKSCHNSFNINNYNLMKFGTIFIYLEKNIKIRNI